MARGAGQDERRALKRAFKAAERLAARQKMILEERSLRLLLEQVEAAVQQAGCDHSLRATRAWAVEHNVDPDALAQSLRHFGGYCDCEVAANVDPSSIYDKHPTPET
jgi:hypothetical protein